MPDSSAEDVVREFWRIMGTNDFFSVNAVLSDDFVLEWPQSGERIRGPGKFARMNSEYPTTGRWSFRLDQIVADSGQVVTRVAVTDGAQSGVAISFFTVKEARITRLIEYWPEPFPAPVHRTHLTEPSDPLD